MWAILFQRSGINNRRRPSTTKIADGLFRNKTRACYGYQLSLLKFPYFNIKLADPLLQKTANYLQAVRFRILTLNISYYSLNLISAVKY